MNRWLISALGAGWGHLNRAIALGRQLAHHGHVHILTNSPYASWLRTQIPLVESDIVVARLTLHILQQRSLERLREEVEAIALSQPWTGIIVDTFPRGLIGEWVDLWPLVIQQYPDCDRVLIQRDLNPDYIRAKNIPTFIHQHYQHVLYPGEGQPSHAATTHPSKIDPPLTPPERGTGQSKIQNPKSKIDPPLAPPKRGTGQSKIQNPKSKIDPPLAPPERGTGVAQLPNSPAKIQNPKSKITSPWLIRNADELPNQSESRSRFAILDAPLIVVCAAGNPPELEFFGLLTTQLAYLPDIQVRCLAFDCPPLCPPELWIRHWPGMELLQLADMVIGGGGYNTVYECAALGIPLVAFHFARRYDRQARRIERWGHRVETVEEAIATTQHLLSSLHQGQVHQKWLNRPVYDNGVCQAVQMLTTPSSPANKLWANGP